MTSDPVTIRATRATATPLWRPVATLCLLALALCCSSGAMAQGRSSGTATRAAGRAAAGPRNAREREMEAIVRAWSARLNAGDNAGIATLFALPAVMIQGQYAYRLVTRQQVAVWHSGLPCSGTIVSISYSGRYATAVFRLGNRGKTRCDQPGALAAARFEIVDGKIKSWQQVEVPPKAKAPPGPVA